MEAAGCKLKKISVKTSRTPSVTSRLLFSVDPHWRNSQRIFWRNSRWNFWKKSVNYYWSIFLFSGGFPQIYFRFFFFQITSFFLNFSRNILLQKGAFFLYSIYSFQSHELSSVTAGIFVDKVFVFRREFLLLFHHCWWDISIRNLEPMPVKLANFEKCFWIWPKNGAPK